MEKRICICPIKLCSNKYPLLFDEGRKENGYRFCIDFDRFFVSAIRMGGEGKGERWALDSSNSSARLPDATLEEEQREREGEIGDWSENSSQN